MSAAQRPRGSDRGARAVLLLALAAALPIQAAPAAPAAKPTPKTAVAPAAPGGPATPARPAPRKPTWEYEITEEQIATWRTQIEQARERIDTARQRLMLAEQAWRNQDQRQYPRGAAKAELETERAAAEKEFAEAEAALPRVLDEARRAGVPPGVLREYEPLG